ncbi:hypothetical protein CHRY9393_02680 [Chryseobacterium fistulae]|uniref:Uncharacterized protein n=1 Tax=Chryseobacterium fistulae TaxID=2675058 RepID=A0A6N4XR89_9FLAO|nr:hypothetical protein CHRY9393_02680 [Chryseobacterium fistulae]
MNKQFITTHPITINNSHFGQMGISIIINSIEIGASYTLKKFITKKTKILYRNDKH